MRLEIKAGITSWRTLNDMVRSFSFYPEKPIPEGSEVRQ